MLAVILLLQGLIFAVSGPPTSPEYLPIRVAEAHGYFAREGVQVTLRSTRAESGAAEALSQGQADLAATSFEAMLRFGTRAKTPRVVFALTAAPPVRLLVSGAHADGIQTVKDLAHGKVAFSTPGSPEQTWMQALMARAGLGATDVELVALGSRGVVPALDAGDVNAAFVAEPVATALVDDGRARQILDLRSPDAVRAALGRPTLNAAVFARSDKRLNDRTLTALARALLAAERLIASGAASVIAERLSSSVVGAAAEFPSRLEATRAIYLRHGLTTPDAIAHMVDIARAHLPLPYTLRLGKPEDMLYLGPARQAAARRPSS